MPRYEYECPNCGRRQEKVIPITELDSTTVFCFCDKPGEEASVMKRLISRPMLQLDYQPYFDENIKTGGIWIESRQHRKQVMKEQGLYEKG